MAFTEHHVYKTMGILYTCTTHLSDKHWRKFLNSKAEQEKKMAKLKNLAKYKRKLQNIKENSRTGKKWPKLKNNDRKKSPNKKKTQKQNGRS